MVTIDLVSISILNDFIFSIRVYRDSNFGFRKLGKGRYAIDLTFISLIFEVYYGKITRYFYDK